MAEYYRVSPKFWTDDTVMRWDETTRLLALYLLTCPHRTTEGLFRLPKAYICADLGWTNETLSGPFSRLINDGFIDYDEDTNIILICNALKYQRPDNANQQKAAIRQLSELPKTRLWDRFIAIAQTNAEPFAKALAEAFPQAFPQAFPKGYAKSPTPTPTPTLTPTPIENDDFVPPSEEKKGNGKDEYPADFEAFWNAYPRKINKKGAFAKWKATLRKPNPPSSQQLIECATRYANTCRRKGTLPEYILHAATFLGPQERWQEYMADEPATEQSVPFTTLSSGEDVLAMIRQRKAGGAH